MPEASSSVVEMSVRSIVFLENIGVLSKGFTVIMVNVDCGESEKVADFSNALHSVVRLTVED